MWICNTCGDTFTRPASGVGGDFDECIDVCPTCRDDNIEEAGRCNVCGEIKPFIDNDCLEHSGICHRCYMNAVDELNNALRGHPEALAIYEDANMCDALFDY